MSSILKKEADRIRLEDDAIWARILQAQEDFTKTGVADP